jgi:GT2 family glycosyltransferase
MPTDPFVSVLIVNYNGKRYLDDCLTALRAQNYPRDRWEVVLVDNGSADGSVEHLRDRYPWVRLVAAGKNLGFAGGNNEGYKHCRGELIALLNNDTVAEPGWLAGLVEAIGEDPKIGGVTSKILLKNEPGVINSVGLNLYRDGRGGDRGFRQPDKGQFDEPAEVFGACGASVLLRREMLEDVGFFDERLFMYCEDLDLAWRARLRGWRFRYTPRSVVHHVHCGSSGEWSPFFIYHAERNRVLVNLKNAPPTLVLYTFAVFAAKAARQWCWLLTRRKRSLPKALAYARAGVSLLSGIPGAARKRFHIRSRRLVGDQALAPLIQPPPGSSP